MQDKLTVYTNNLVSLNDKYVGRIDRDSYLTESKPHKPTNFYPGTIVPHSGFDVPHEIKAALYIGGPADWKINPDFTAEVKAILCDPSTYLNDPEACESL